MEDQLLATLISDQSGTISANLQGWFTITREAVAKGKRQSVIVGEKKLQI